MIAVVDIVAALAALAVATVRLGHANGIARINCLALVACGAGAIACMLYVRPAIAATVVDVALALAASRIRIDRGKGMVVAGRAKRLARAPL